jgi:hypothetical protein
MWWYVFVCLLLYSTLFDLHKNTLIQSMSFREEREPGAPVTTSVKRARAANHLQGQTLYCEFLVDGDTRNVAAIAFGLESTNYCQNVMGSFDYLQDTSVTIGLFQAVGGWLVDRKKSPNSKDPDGEYYAPSVSLQYTSNFYNAIVDKIPRHRLLDPHQEKFNKDGDPVWYANLRHNMQGIVGERKYETGETFTQQSDPIGRILHSLIQGALINKGTVKAYEDRAGLTIEAQGINR